MSWNALRILILLAPMLLVACGASLQPGKPPTEVRYLPSPAKPCLAIPPPERPKLEPCPPSPAPCPDEDLNVARLLDHLVLLDRWARLYAWPICKDVSP